MTPSARRRTASITAPPSGIATRDIECVFRVLRFLASQQIPAKSIISPVTSVESVDEHLSQELLRSETSSLSSEALMRRIALVPCREIGERSDEELTEDDPLGTSPDLLASRGVPGGGDPSSPTSCSFLSVSDVRSAFGGTVSTNFETGYFSPDSRTPRGGIPRQLTTALDAYRMAATNLNTDGSHVLNCKENLRSALVSAFPQHANDIAQLLSDSASSEETPSQSISSFTSSASAAATSAPTKPSSNTVDPVTPLSVPLSHPRVLSRANPKDMHSMQEIVPGLWCGSYHPAANKEVLLRAGITAICCCIGTAPRFPGEFMYLTLPADDRNDYNIRAYFDQTFDFIENTLINERGAVLVHCGAGISRGPTITAAYLIRKLRVTSTMAVKLVQEKRLFANPNTGFRAQLRDYARSIRRMGSMSTVPQLQPLSARQSVGEASAEE